MVLASSILKPLAIALALLTSVTAHPGEHDEDISHEIMKRDTLASTAKRSLSACAATLKSRALAQRAVARRNAKAAHLRAKRQLAPTKPFLKARDLAALEAFEATTHESNLTGISIDSESSLLFGGNTSCILTPEVTQGPYFVTGEYIRSDVSESQAGVPLHLEFQFIDISTCEPIPSLMIDIWSANSTGVYSGVVVSGNGAGTSDTTNINNTFLRGLQPTDSDGVSAFDTIFPGHYEGRAVHIHVVAHENGTVLPNATYTGGAITHVGQLFFDESLITAVEAVEPYLSNTQAYTSNDEDMWAPSQAENDYDPFPEYVLLGDTISDGILGWISIGIDTTANYTSTVDVAGELTAEGGVSNSNGGTGGGAGGGFGGGNGTAPGGLNGTIPSGGNSTSVGTPGSISTSPTVANGTLALTTSIASTLTGYGYLLEYAILSLLAVMGGMLLL